MSFECCQYGDMVETDEDGEAIYPDLCDCICHVNDEEYY